MIFGDRCKISFEMTRGQFVAALAALFAMSMPGTLGSEVFSLNAFYPGGAGGAGGAYVPAIAYSAPTTYFGFNSGGYAIVAKSTSALGGYSFTNVPSIGPYNGQFSVDANFGNNNINLIPGSQAVYINGQMNQMCKWVTITDNVQVNCPSNWMAITLGYGPNAISYNPIDVYKGITGYTPAMLCCNATFTVDTEVTSQ